MFRKNSPAKSAKTSSTSSSRVTRSKAATTSSVSTSPTPSTLLPEDDLFGDLRQELHDLREDNARRMLLISESLIKSQSLIERLLEANDGLLQALKEVASYLSRMPSEFEDVKKAVSRAPLKSFSDAISSNLLSNVQTVLLIRKARDEEEEKRKRKKNIIVKGLIESTEEADSLFANSLSSLAFGQQKKLLKHHRIGKASATPRLLRICCESEADVFKIFRVFRERRMEMIEQYRSVRVRQDFVSSDLALYRALCERALQLNDEEGAQKWTVRSLRLQRLETPQAWAVVPRRPPSATSET